MSNVDLFTLRNKQLSIAPHPTAGVRSAAGGPGGARAAGQGVPHVHGRGLCATAGRGRARDAAVGAAGHGAAGGSSALALRIQGLTFMSWCCRKGVPVAACTGCAPAFCAQGTAWQNTACRCLPQLSMQLGARPTSRAVTDWVSRIAHLWLFTCGWPPWAKGTPQTHTHMHAHTHAHTHMCLTHPCPLRTPRDTAALTFLAHPHLQLKALGIDNIMKFEWLAPPTLHSPAFCARPPAAQGPGHRQHHEV